jgi:hypothetical protein
MSIEALLTFLTVLLAVMALVPRERSEDIQVRLGFLPRLAGIVAGILVLYWSFLDQIQAAPGLRRLTQVNPWVWRWNTASIYFATLLFAGALATVFYVRRLSPYRLPKLCAVIANALSRRRFGECLHLVEQHLETIERTLAGDYAVERLRRRFLPTLQEQHLSAVVSVNASTVAAAHDESGAPSGRGDGDADTEPIAADRASLEGMVIALPPEPSRLRSRLTELAATPRDAAHSLLRVISLTPAFVRELTRSSPYLGVSLLKLRSSWLMHAFADTYADQMLADSDSIFYRELIRASNVESNGMPLVEAQEQPLLALLCEDACRPHGARYVWPFLHAALDSLDARGAREMVDILNEPCEDYFESGRWRSAPFAGLYLLRIVASRVAVSPEAPSLNLYVVDSFVRDLLKVLSTPAGEDDFAEWPTKIHYLIYECVSLLGDIVDVSHSKAGELRKVRNALESGGGRRPVTTLPEHAAEVLGKVVARCLKTNKLSNQFKGYLLEAWWGTYWEKNKKQPYPLSDRVLDGLLEGGRMNGSNSKVPIGLEAAMAHVDLMLRIDQSGKRFGERLGLDLAAY